MDTIGQSQLKGTGFAVFNKLGTPLKGRIKAKNLRHEYNKRGDIFGGNIVCEVLTPPPAPSSLLRADKRTLEESVLPVSLKTAVEDTDVISYLYNEMIIALVSFR